MGSTALRSVIYYISSIRLSRALAVIAGLLVIYILKRWIFPGEPSPYGIVRQKVGEKDPLLLTNEEIQEQIDAMQDSRPVHCRDHGYDFTRIDGPDTVSILLDFNGREFYKLQIAISAIVENTPYDLYKEIVVIDDGTEDERVRKQAAKFLRESRFAKVKMYRSDTFDGQSKSRFKASQLATGSILVYVSSTTMVNRGWLQPLISHVAQDESLIAVSHVDNMLSGNRFFRVDDHLMSVFSWALYTVHADSSGSRTDPAQIEMVNIPVMRGDAFAIKKSFLAGIGNFDEGMRGAGGMDSGHHLELSLRAWLCGGKVQKSQCSRVVIPNALTPHHVDSYPNYRRITELWFDDYKSVAYSQGEVSSTLPQDEEMSVKMRRSQLKQVHAENSITCSSFDWYLKKVAHHLVVPSERMLHYGKIKAKTNYCLRVASKGAGHEEDEELDMSLCRQYMYDYSMMFEYNSVGWIFNARGQCLQPVPDTGRVTLRLCNEDNEQQRWKVVGRDRIQHVGSSGGKGGGGGGKLGGKCLSQVNAREEESLELFHYAAIVDCNRDPKDFDEIGRFQTWEFVHY